MEQTTQQDGRVARGNARKELILDAAVRQFARRGYERTRIADIARDAGMTDAGLIHHYPTKLELFMAVVYRREEVYAPVSRSADSVAELFHSFCDAVRAAAAEPDYLRFRIMLSGTGVLEDHPATDHLTERLLSAIEHLVRILDAGAARGELLPQQDSRAIALHILALNDGVRAQWALLPQEIDYPDAFEKGLRVLYRSVSGRDLAADR